MSEVIDYSEVPYLQDILDYLPINPVDDEDILTYIQNVTNLVTVNYKYGQYQFSYFGIHLLYMTYIYCTIWKISKIEPKRYCDAVVFARPYNNRENDVDVENINSIFEYSLIPEKDIPKIFKIIDLDKSQISRVSGLVDIRNEMAHASGKFEILTEEGFNVSTNSVLTSIRNINNSMDKQIRDWFKRMLVHFCNNGFADYTKVKDIIEEQMIQNFKMSINELLVCNEMSVIEMITSNREYEEKLKEFKASVLAYCQDLSCV